MEKPLTALFKQSVLIFCLLLLFMLMFDKQEAKAEEPLTVEGVWEVISVSSAGTESSLIGSKVSISRKGNSYTVDSVPPDGNPTVYKGNERRIVRTSIELLNDTTNVREGNKRSPTVERALDRKFAGQKCQINSSYTLSADGNFLTREQDSKRFMWETNTTTGEVRNIRYEINPGYYKRTLKRVSGPPLTPVKKPFTSVSAAAVGRGEFYILTKDGQKLTGKDILRVPLEEGTKVITGSSGHVQLLLPDETVFTIGANSDIVIDKFVYDDDRSSKAIMVNVSKGVFRWVTGKIKPLKDPTEMKVKLPVMAVGIRGTDLEATVKPDGSGSLVLYFGQLEITENKTGFTFIMNAGYKVSFKADGTVSRPLKVN